MRADLAPTHNRGGFLAGRKALSEAALHDGEYCAFEISFLKFKSQSCTIVTPITFGKLIKLRLDFCSVKWDDDSIYFIVLSTKLYRMIEYLILNAEVL